MTRIVVVVHTLMRLSLNCCRCRHYHRWNICNLYGASSLPFFMLEVYTKTCSKLVWQHAKSYLSDRFQHSVSFSLYNANIHLVPLVLCQISTYYASSTNTTHAHLVSSYFNIYRLFYQYNLYMPGFPNLLLLGPSRSLLLTFNDI